MKVFPSTSRTEALFALSMNRGIPPTDRNARTGEFTPPGINVFARANSLPEVVVFSRDTGGSASFMEYGGSQEVEFYLPRGEGVKVKGGISEGFTIFTKRYYRTA